MDYYKRIIDKKLESQLKVSHSVVIEGPKWCGKTKTALQYSKSQLFLQDTDNSASYDKIVQTKPSLLLNGSTPRLLDEWVDYPILWDTMRLLSDQRGLPGQFILTGSAVPLERNEDSYDKESLPRHSGTGRVSWLKMRPMSLFESLESSGSVSIHDLFEGKTDIECMSSVSIEDLAFYIVRGGWPQAVLTKDRDAAIIHAQNYVDAVIKNDISRVGKKKEPMNVRQLLRSFARNISTMTPQTTIAEDMRTNSLGLSDKTVGEYISDLEKIFVIENTPAWNASLRSKTAIRTSHKLQFVDPSIAAAVMRLSPQKLLDDFLYFGFLFESLCSRDLKIYAEANDGEVFHYHDRNNLEADAVIALHDGRWAAIEIKLGSKEIEEGAKHLLKLASLTVTKPSFLMVVTGGEYAYRREDGVFVVPLGVLKD